MKKTETVVKSEAARAFVVSVGTERARDVCSQLLGRCSNAHQELAARVGVTAVEAAIAELEK
jgi:hypothetical protein